VKIINDEKVGKPVFRNVEKLLTFLMCLSYQYCSFLVCNIIGKNTDIWSL